MRKLVFYSQQTFPQTSAVDEQWLSLFVKSKPCIGYIPSSNNPKPKYYRECQAYYGRYGITLPICFELGSGYCPDKTKDLFSCDAIHLSGGNTIQFLNWLRTRSLLTPLRDYVAGGGVLIGVSAGAILMTPDIRTTLLSGALTAEMSDFSALGLVDFAFVPHFGRTNTELSNLKAYSKRHQHVVVGCPDDAGIVINHDGIKCIGNLVIVSNGEVVESLAVGNGRAP